MLKSTLGGWQPAGLAPAGMTAASILPSGAGISSNGYVNPCSYFYCGIASIPSNTRSAQVHAAPSTTGASPAPVQSTLNSYSYTTVPPVYNYITLPGSKQWVTTNGGRLVNRHMQTVMGERMHSL